MSSKTNERGFSALRAELRKEREKVKRLSDQLATLQSDNGIWELIKDNQNVKNKIISEYLISLSGRQNVSLVGQNGFSALTPVNKPKNLADAKRLADKIIKS